MKSEASLQNERRSVLQPDIKVDLKLSQQPSASKVQLDQISDVDSSLERYKKRNQKKVQESLSSCNLSHRYKKASK